MSFGFGFGFPKNYVAALFTPGQLFTTGVNGAWYDPSDFSTMFQGAAGTTPVTAVGQPVGLMLDKSKGLVLGPELVTNGDFSGGTTGWSASQLTGSVATITAVNGRLRITNNAATGRGVAYQAVSTVVGKTYVFSATGYDGTAGTGNSAVRIGTSLGAFDNGNTTFTNGVSRNVYFTATATTTFIALNNIIDTANLYVEFDNISVRELPGNHAYNPSGNSANFPVLSARYNLLTKTEDFGDAVWTKTAGGTGSLPSVTSGFPAPDGTNTATQVVFNTGAGTTTSDESALSYYAAGGATIGVAYRSGLLVKGSAGAQLLIRHQSAAGYVKHTLTGGWDYLTQTETSALSAVNLNIGLRQAVSGTINSTITVSIWHPDLRVANDVLNQPSYQRVNTATDYDTEGFKPYLSFNGINQWLQTNSIDFTYGDKMFVCAGVRKLSDAATAIVAEMSANYAGNNGVFALFSPGAANSYQYDLVFKGTAASEVFVNSLTYAAPITNVVSGIGNISAPSATLRVNGTQAAQSTASQGTGNYGNYPLYIGARAGTSLWFNGRLYQLIVADGGYNQYALEDDNLFLLEDGTAMLTEYGANPVPTVIAAVESFVNQKTGAY